MAAQVRRLLRRPRRRIVLERCGGTGCAQSASILCIVCCCGRGAVRRVRQALLPARFAHCGLCLHKQTATPKCDSLNNSVASFLSLSSIAILQRYLVLLHHPLFHPTRATVRTFRCWIDW